MSRPLRIAVYGTISARGGSTATGFFRMVEAWLAAGHAIDLYSPGTFIDPAGLVASPRFRYFAVPLPAWRTPLRLAPRRGLPRLAKAVVHAGLAEVQRGIHEQLVADAIVREHRARPYDAMVALNILNRLDVKGALPVVSFPQGPPRGESDFVTREPELVRRECGWRGYAVLRGVYLVRDPKAQRHVDRSTAIVASSEWSRAMFERAGAPPPKLHVLAPPVDVARFAAAPRPADPARFTFLWLGRVVPRKRLPLALDALTLLRARRPGARLVVIGGAGYGGMFRYHVPPLVEGATRGEPVPHDEVPALMARTDVLLQPSENENFGTSVAEALACGVPSVLGPTNGTLDVLEDGAFRFDRYEPAQVAAAMERAMDAVLADPAGIAQRARAIAVRRFAAGDVAARAVDLVREVSDAWRANRPQAVGT